MTSSVSREGHRPRRARRAARAGALVVALGLVPVAAQAETEDDRLSIDDLPTIADSELDGLRSSISIPDITAISIPDIEPFEPEVTTDGADQVVSLDTDVLFEFGKAELADEAKVAVADAVKDVPDGAKVRVEGHTDSIGSDADNLKLSKDRAQAVADVIEDERDDLDVTVSGKGEKDPVAPNTSGSDDNPEGREKNRRVEIRYAD